MVEKMKTEHVEDVVRIHMLEFRNSQSTKFGHDFLKSYYNGAIDSENSSSFVYIDEDGTLEGFIFGGTNKQKLSRQILLNSKLSFIKAGLRNLFKNPITSIIRFSSYLKHYILPGGDAFYADDTACLDSVAILSNRRGRGIADALMKVFLQDLNHKKVSACRLGVLAENKSARAFYERNGFIQVNNEGTIYIYHFDEKYKNAKSLQEK